MTFCHRHPPTKYTTTPYPRYKDLQKQTTPNQPKQLTTQIQTTNPQEQREENNQENKKQKKQGKSERGFLSYLIGGLILITFGAFTVMQISNPNSANSAQNWAIMLILIGIIIITSAIYIALTARHPTTPNPTTNNPQTHNPNTYVFSSQRKIHQHLTQNNNNLPPPILQ